MLSSFLCIDFEASCLGRRSYPIEIAVADPLTGSVHAWLIRPTTLWLTEGEWHADSAAIHGITQAQLATEGADSADVYRALLPLTANRQLVSDNPSHDAKWLAMLMAEAQAAAPPPIQDLVMVAWKLAVEANRKPDFAWQEASEQARRRFHRSHRAGDDAQYCAELLRLIAEPGATFAKSQRSDNLPG